MLALYALDGGVVNFTEDSEGEVVKNVLSQAQVKAILEDNHIIFIFDGESKPWTPQHFIDAAFGAEVGQPVGEYFCYSQSEWGFSGNIR